MTSQDFVLCIIDTVRLDWAGPVSLAPTASSVLPPITPSPKGTIACTKLAELKVLFWCH